MFGGGFGAFKYGMTYHGIASLVNLFGIESPGLTASLAIGEEVARYLSD